MRKITVVNIDRCQPDTCNYRCINVCPINRTGKKSNPIIIPKAIKLRKKSVFPYIIENHCINCNICVSSCFVSAIKVVNIPDGMEDKKPTHQYEESLFKLYGLPIINQGKVTGIIGENGIGKSTLLNILAGKIKPNGGYFKDKSFKKFLNDLKTPGMARYIEDLHSGNLKVSLKDQNLAKYDKTSITPQRLIDQIQELENPEIIDLLQIRKFLQKQYSQLSGGEKQRVAIALTMMQRADVYLLDEPATYLDVKQRLNLVWILKAKLNKNRAILVVEHDITVLDYLSELIHILWGEPHIYGVISRALPVRKGLNSFLSGWLKEENIHFRYKIISFKRTIKERKWEGRGFIEWPSINFAREEVDGFQLEIIPGRIYQGETLVILGENGLGKTTFANIIVGKIPQFTQVRAKISYKPQLISKNFDFTVLDFLQQVTYKHLNTKAWKLQLLQPLGIDHILDRELKELSGGETQRVYIGACLARDADLYILDEPSAFLDALERTKIASIIRNQTKRRPKSSVITIEHDIQLSDITSDRIMLFTGEPAKKGFSTAPMGKRDGMNEFLKSLNITFRKDPDTGRARINKENSQMDKKQKEIGEYYFTETKSKFSST